MDRTKRLQHIVLRAKGLNFRNYQRLTSRSAGDSDHVCLRVEGAAESDTEALAVRIRRALGISMNEIRVEAAVEGDLVDDQRY